MTGSADAGTWGVMNLPSGNPSRAMYGVDTDGDGKWVRCGASGYVWTSSDDAVSWTEVGQVEGNNGLYNLWYDVKYDGSGTWYMCGKAGSLAQSTDNGANWTVIPNAIRDLGMAGGNQNNFNLLGIAFNKIFTS